MRNTIGFVKVKSIIGVTAIDGTADSIPCIGEDMTFICVSGNIWINPKTTAIANTTALLLTAGQSVDMNIASALSIISDGSGGTYQCIIWEAVT